MAHTNFQLDSCEFGLGISYPYHALIPKVNMAKPCSAAPIKFKGTEYIG